MEIDEFKVDDKDAADPTILSASCSTCGKIRRTFDPKGAPDLKEDRCLCPIADENLQPCKPVTKLVTAEEEAPAVVDAPAKESTDQHYTVVEKLGEGGMATVFRVRDPAQREMAMKVMNAAVVTDKAAKKRFVKEVDIVSNLTHPNIAQVYGCFTPDDAAPYMIMEYVDGLTLAEVLKHEHHLTAKRTIDISIQVCEALQHAHLKSVVHRDLKPSNIIITEGKDGSDNVKLVDFGIAKVAPARGGVTELTQKGEVFGSPDYMSPEQCKGVETDARSDIYSLGCVMYESLIGEPIFKGDNSIQILIHHINTPVNAAVRRLKGKGIPGDVRAVVAKMLAKNPARRYQSTSELLSELKRLRENKTPKVVRFEMTSWAVGAVVVALIAMAVPKNLLVISGSGRAGPNLNKFGFSVNPFPWTVPRPTSNDPEAWIARVEQAAREGDQATNFSMHLPPNERNDRRREYARIYKESYDELDRMGPRIIPVLTKHFNDSSRGVSRLCSDLLVSFGQASVGPMTDILKQQIGTSRSAAAEEVLIKLAPTSNQAFLSLIQSSNSQERRAGALLLACTLLPANQSLYGSLRFHPNELRLRQVARSSRYRISKGSDDMDLANQIDRSTSQIIIHALAKETDPDTRVNLIAVLSLLASRSPDIQPVLTKLLKQDKDPAVRTEAVMGLGELVKTQSNEADRIAVNEILSALKGDADDRVRVASVDALLANSAELGDSILPPLEGAARSPSDLVRLKALQALCRLSFDHPQCRWALAEALKQSDGTTTAEALRDLARLGNDGRPYAPVVYKFLSSDSSSDVRYAVQALKSMGEAVAPQSVHELLSAISIQRWPAKREIIRSLPSFGPEAKKAIPELQRIVDSNATEDTPVRSQASRTLAQLERM